MLIKTIIFMSTVLTTFPQLGNTESVWDNIKQGATKAKNKVSDTITSTKESLSDEETPGATRDKLDAMAEQSLARLIADKPSAADLFKQSFGYAAFDTRQINFTVGGGYGRGVVVEKETDARTYMKIAFGGVDAGIGFGERGVESQLVILFENAQNVHKFIEKGHDAKAEVSAMAGDERKELTARFTDGVAVFVLTGEGWNVEVHVAGAKYWKDDDLNAR